MPEENASIFFFRFPLYGIHTFSQKPLYNANIFCYNTQQQNKEVMTMKVLNTVPVDIDELIFAGETTVPSDR